MTNRQLEGHAISHVMSRTHSEEQPLVSVLPHFIGLDSPQCVILQCVLSYIRPPKYGFVLFPCTREEGHSCGIVCAHGFNAAGPTQQICENDTTTNSLIWNEGPICEGEGVH